jgi:hypothetical protein
VDRELAIMKYGAGSSRFFSLAFCASSGMWSFTRTKVSITTLPAFKSPAPFQISKKFKALLVILKQFIKLFSR